MIQLSVKTKYGIAAMIELARLQKSGPVQIKTICDHPKIPQNYVEQLLIDLKRGCLVTSTRGKHGGYQLARRASAISISEIVTCLEGPKSLTDGHKGCETLRFYWKKMDQDIAKVFSHSLASVLKDQQNHQKVVTYTI